MMSRGGKRLGAGRPNGAANKIGHDVRALARDYSGGAIVELAKLAGLVEYHPAAASEQDRIAALKELLDRGYGKAPQSIDVTAQVTRPEGLTDAQLLQIAASGRVDCEMVGSRN
jgi:hypothetical protein